MQTQFPLPQIRSQSLLVLQFDVQQPGGTRYGSGASVLAVGPPLQSPLCSSFVVFGPIAEDSEVPGAEIRDATAVTTNAPRTRTRAFLFICAPPIRDADH